MRDLEAPRRRLPLYDSYIDFEIEKCGTQSRLVVVQEAALDCWFNNSRTCQSRVDRVHIPTTIWCQNNDVNRKMDVLQKLVDGLIQIFKTLACPFVDPNDRYYIVWCNKLLLLLSCLSYTAFRMKVNITYSNGPP